MLNIQNAKSHRNRLAVRYAVIILLCGGLLMISGISTTRTHAQDQSQERPVKFRRVGAPILNQYIVVFNDDTRGDEIDSLASDLANAQRGALRAVYRYALKGFSIHGISEAQALALSEDPRVEFVEENCEGTTGSVQNIDYSQPHAAWHLDRIDQDPPVTGQGVGTYTYNQTGSVVHAYVLDTGILSSHVEFGGRVVFGADFVNDGINGDDCEINRSEGTNPGHGTQVAGALGATTYGGRKECHHS